MSQLGSEPALGHLSAYPGPGTVLVAGATTAKVTESQAALADHGHVRMPALTFLEEPRIWIFV